MDKQPITATGYELLKTELRTLKSVDRPNVVKAIAEARELGDLSENAEYHAAREKQSFIEGRIQQLESALAQAHVIDPESLSGDIVKFGATVSLLNCENDQMINYSIVGDLEANVSKGMISISSPVAKALIGKAKGDFVEVKTPSGFKEYEIMEFSFKPILVS